MNNYTFLIDIDYKPTNPNKFAEEFTNKIKFVEDILKIFVEEVEVFETKKGIHVYVYASSERKISDEEIVVIQLALGSDYKREIFNWSRVISNPKPKHWNVLFKSKEKITKLSKMLTILINNKLDGLGKDL